MPLKTDFKDEILAEGTEYRVYDIVNSGGTPVYENIHLVRKDTPQQEGDDYGAEEINTLNETVNNCQKKVLSGSSVPNAELGSDGDVYFMIE